MCICFMMAVQWFAVRTCLTLSMSAHVRSVQLLHCQLSAVEVGLSPLVNTARKNSGTLISFPITFSTSDDLHHHHSTEEPYPCEAEHCWPSRLPLQNYKEDGQTVSRWEVLEITNARKNMCVCVCVCFGLGRYKGQEEEERRILKPMQYS